MLQIERLKELLRYDSLTGIFTWRASRGPLKAGSVAGSINTGYVLIGIDKRYYAAHRLAWFYETGEWPISQIDHIDHNRSNNIFSNLRDATQKENGRNQRKNINNRSGVVGVSTYSGKIKGLRHVALIVVNGKRKYLGTFNTLKEANRARAKAKKKYGFHPNHGK